MSNTTTSMESVVTQAFLANLRAVGMNIAYQVPPPTCYLLRLPSELRHEITDHLDTKRDLYNLSRTCKTLEQAVLRRLYRRVNLDIPDDRSLAWNTGGYLTLRPQVTRSVQQLNVRGGAFDRRQPHFNKRRISNAASSEPYTTLLLQQIPPEQLTSFSFLHKTPLSGRLLRTLNESHHSSLSDFCFYELDPGLELTDSSLLTNLRSLECHVLNDGKAIGALVAANKNLRRLVLGQTKELMAHYQTAGAGQWGHPREPLQNLKSIIDIGSLSDLQELSLTGLNVMPLVPMEIEEAMWLTQLTSLTLQSCTNAEHLLSSLAAIFQLVRATNDLDVEPTPAEATTETTTETTTPTPPQPSLTHFSLRTEYLNPTLRNNLPTFLTSFQTLQSLTLLISPTTVPTPLSTLLAPHPSLTHLTLESRLQPRTSLPHDPSRPFTTSGGGYTSESFTSTINTLTTTTPHLTELSLGFPWRDEVLRLRPSTLPHLTSLHTIHIRNFPESSTHTQLGDYAIREYATKFTEWIYGDIQTVDPPLLSTLSIGPTVYESRYVGFTERPSHVPEFQRCHHFALDWAKTRFGRWAAVVTPVSERYMEEVRDQKPLGGVFEAVWLR